MTPSENLVPVLDGQPAVGLRVIEANAVGLDAVDMGEVPGDEMLAVAERCRLLVANLFHVDGVEWEEVVAAVSRAIELEKPVILTIVPRYRRRVEEVLGVDVSGSDFVEVLGRNQHSSEFKGLLHKMLNGDIDYTPPPVDRYEEDWI